jgi:hypothetical protein
MVAALKSSLSPARRRLVELMQRTNFGRLENIMIRDGDPVLDDPGPRVVLEVKFAGDNGVCAQVGTGDFSLKAQIIDLFAHFDRLRHARIEVLTIKHGLPFTMHVEGVA